MTCTHPSAGLHTVHECSLSPLVRMSALVGSVVSLAEQSEGLALVQNLVTCVIPTTILRVAHQVTGCLISSPSSPVPFVFFLKHRSDLSSLSYPLLKSSGLPELSRSNSNLPLLTSADVSLVFLWALTSPPRLNASLTPLGLSVMLGLLLLFLEPNLSPPLCLGNSHPFQSHPQHHHLLNSTSAPAPQTVSGSPRAP